MTPNRLESIRAILLACAIALVATLAGCASRQASATPTDSAVPASGVSPTASGQPGAPLVGTATPDPGMATPGAGVGGDAPSATATAASAMSAPVMSAAATVGDSDSSPVATATAEATPGAAGASTAAVPLFLTITAPAEELLEVPTGTAEVTISGKTVSSAVLSVNGSLVIPDSSGNFQVTVPVDDDVTLVEVVASDATGAELHAQRVIVRD